MLKFIENNATAIFALIGTFVGGLTSFLATWGLRRSELRLRLREKILDKRIDAHERIIQVVKPMRTMVVLENQAPLSDLARAPYFFKDRKTFEEWYFAFASTANQYSTWLTIEVTRELYYAQDYLVNLHEFLKQVDSSKYFEIGALIRDDFVDLSSSIEQLAFDYFTKDLGTFRINDLRQHHKYDINETKRRLDGMKFRTCSKEIQEVSKGAG